MIFLTFVRESFVIGFIYVAGRLGATQRFAQGPYSTMQTHLESAHFQGGKVMADGRSARRFLAPTLAALAVLALLPLGGNTARAADRMVIAEEFTSPT
jgi:hypothetical protein